MASSCTRCGKTNADDAAFCSSCGTNLTPSPEGQADFTRTFDTPSEELKTGAVFAGRYQIIEELGRGGMGRVYRARDAELDEEVALKLINPEISSDRTVIDRFKREIKLARKISHKNVGRVHELMEHGGTRFITMEYVPGEDLKSFIRRAGRLSRPGPPTSPDRPPKGWRKPTAWASYTGTSNPRTSSSTSRGTQKSWISASQNPWISTGRRAAAR